MLGRPVDVVETSRGCTYDCSFCSIIEMRGRNFHTWSDRARHRRHPSTRTRRGARAIFLVDDNITLNVKRFRALCDAIVDAGLNDIDYIVQGMTRAIAAGGDALAALMRARRLPLRVPRHRERRWTSGPGVSASAAAKNAERAGRTGDRQRDPTAAVDVLHRHGMFVVGGLIVGNP